jgi:hypothetical protein
MRPSQWRGAGLVMVVLATFSSPALACDSASCSLLTRGQSGLLAPGSLRLDLSFAYTDLGTRLAGSDDVDAVERPRIDVLRQRVFPSFHRELDGRETVFSLDAAYGLTPRFTLLASLPFWTRHSHDVAHVGVVQTFTAEGNGDALVGARYAVGPPGLVAGLALKLPTGTDRLDGEFGGGLLDPTLQPGSGSFDVVPSLQYARPRLVGLDWSVAASYQITTTNSLGYRFGNLTIVSVGASRALGRNVSASLQAKLFHQDRNRYRNAGVASTGATLVYVTPGLRLEVGKGLSLYGFAQLLPRRSVNEQQLAPSLALLSGVSKTF